MDVLNPGEGSALVIDDDGDDDEDDPWFRRLVPDAATVSHVQAASPRGR